MAQNQSPSRLSMAATTSRSRDTVWASSTESCADPGQRHAKTDCQSARRGEAHAHASEAAGPDRHGEQRDIAPVDAGLGEDSLDRRQQARRLVAATFAQTRPDARRRARWQRQGRSRRNRRRGPSCVFLVHEARSCCNRPARLRRRCDARLRDGGQSNGQPVYRNAECWLHREAADKLAAAILARPLGLRLRIFDALRPVEAQWALWNARPDPEFLADPRRGSPHSRGVAVDLTLLDGDRELDMGTAFDAFTPLSHHGRTDVSAEAQRNRLLLMGLMTSAGWDFYRNEWWHYQLFDQRRYPLVSGHLPTDDDVRALMFLR